MSAWFQGMEPEKAAGVLKSLANEGKMELAVQLLANFEEREASKVLAAIDDTQLTVELAEAFQSFKRAPKKDAGKK
jgi:flagellar motility protein MotE (MotC chaperone)